MISLRSVLVFYGLFIFLFVVFSYTFTDPNLPEFSLFESMRLSERMVSSAIYGISVIVLLGFYLFFLKQARKEKFASRNLKRVVLISSFLFLAYPAMLSYDIFNYIATAKVTYLYKENPYIVMPIEFVGEPMLSFMHAANKTALYGPAWILVTAIPFFLGFNIFIPTLLLFKLFVGLFYFLTITILWRMTKNYFLVALFAFHPLIIIETFVSAHNDIVMMFLAVMSFYLLQRKRLFLATILLVLSVFMKFSTLFLAPVFVYCLIETLQKKQIDWTHIFRIAFFSMLAIFLLSFLREEIYPWYAVWFLSFLPLMKPSKVLTTLVIVFTVSLLLRYLPFMILGTHFGSTPLIKWLITFAPISLVLIYYLFKRRWLKIS